jgi:hypothetical protein
MPRSVKRLSVFVVFCEEARSEKRARKLLFFNNLAGLALARRGGFSGLHALLGGFAIAMAAEVAMSYATESAVFR